MTAQVTRREPAAVRHLFNKQGSAFKGINTIRKMGASYKEFWVITGRYGIYSNIQKQVSKQAYPYMFGRNRMAWDENKASLSLWWGGL